MDLFFQTNLTHNVTSVTGQQPLSCLSANITHDIRVSTCVLASSSLSSSHTHYVRHILPHFTKLLLRLGSTGLACMLAFFGLKSNRMFVVRLLHSFAMLCSMFVYVWCVSYISTSGPFQNGFLVSVISSVGPSYVSCFRCSSGFDRQ